MTTDPPRAAACSSLHGVAVRKCSKPGISRTWATSSSHRRAENSVQAGQPACEPGVPRRCRGHRGLSRLNGSGRSVLVAVRS